VHHQDSNTLVLEDLEASPTWRLATEDDIDRAETGVALARWYSALHTAGRRYLDRSPDLPTFLKRESDTLTAESVRGLGIKLGLADVPGWALAVKHVESLKHAMRRLPETFTYNDFYWGNLALSTQETSSSSSPRQAHSGMLNAHQSRSVQAIVFDYHLFGIGLAYSDCRNATSSLRDPAAKAFWDAYGPYEPQEALLDAPMSILVALNEAGRRPRFPSWAEDPLAEVRNGVLERTLRRVLEMV
jgi:hypothetical protein